MEEKGRDCGGIREDEDEVVEVVVVGAVVERKPTEEASLLAAGRAATLIASVVMCVCPAAGGVYGGVGKDVAVPGGRELRRSLL